MHVLGQVPLFFFFLRERMATTELNKIDGGYSEKATFMLHYLQVLGAKASLNTLRNDILPNSTLS